MRRVRQTYLYPNGTEWITGGFDKPTKLLSTSYDLAFINEAIETTETDWETLQSRIGRPERSHGSTACWATLILGMRPTSSRSEPMRIA